MPQDSGAQAAQADDAVSRVLRSNAGEFEKREVLHAALVGILVGAINFMLEFILMWQADDVFLVHYVGLVYGPALIATGLLVLRRSIRATAVMFGLLMLGALSRLLYSILTEQLNIVGIVVAVIWGLVIWFKVLPAFDSIKFLTAGDTKPLAPVGTAVETVIVAFGGLVLLSRTIYYLSAFFI